MARSTYFDLGRSEDARPGSESAMPNVFNLKILSNAQFGRECEAYTARNQAAKIQLRKSASVVSSK